MGEHVAAEGKHTCDYCNQEVTKCLDEDKNHKCDVCEKEMGEHVAAEGKHTCDYCNQEVTKCLDENKDNKCDVCDKELSDPNQSQNPSENPDLEEINLDCSSFLVSKLIPFFMGIGLVFIILRKKR